MNLLIYFISAVTNLILGWVGTSFLNPIDILTDRKNPEDLEELAAWLVLGVFFIGIVSAIAVLVEAFSY